MTGVRGHGRAGTPAATTRRVAGAVLRVACWMALALCCRQAVATPGPAAADPNTAGASVTLSSAGLAERRLLAIYHLIDNGRIDDATQSAQRLVSDVPGFLLARALLADLEAHARNDAPGPSTDAWQDVADRVELASEARLRLQAAIDRPKPGLVPAQFVALPASSRHAIAVDTSRARLYLFERGPDGLRLVADHYASVGSMGVDKFEEGDRRTPLGVYFVNSRLDRRQVDDFYGAGALTLNYPNEYDRRRGRSGSGIWLHGVPSDTFARAPLATDGCVVLANADMDTLLKAVSPRSTPVLVARRIEWVTPDAARAAAEPFMRALTAWRDTKAAGDLPAMLAFYSAQFESGKRARAQLPGMLKRELAGVASLARPRAIELKDLSVLSWQDDAHTMVVTFGEVWRGRLSGRVKRQYWGLEGGQWRIFYEGDLR